MMKLNSVFNLNKLPATSLGFTLIELLVVMVIIGLLAGYVGPKYISQMLGMGNATQVFNAPPPSAIAVK